MSKAEPDVFNRIAIDERGENACTPEIEDEDFRGFVIVAPERVTFERGEITDEAFGTFADVPVCIHYVLDVPAEPLPDAFDDLIELVARDAESGEVYRGNMASTDSEEPRPPGQPVTPEEVEGLCVAGALTPNLVRYVPIPAATANYEVWLEFNEGAMRSNTVRVELIMEEPDGEG